MRISFTPRDFTLLAGILLAITGPGCGDADNPVTGPVDLPPTFTPREVPLVEVTHGPDPGQAAVSWMILTWSSFPIEEYLVAVSLTGPITEDNWDAATMVERYPAHPGQVRIRNVYGAEAGLAQGATVWFAVRARDSGGRLSPLSHSPRLTLTREWWVEGRVLDQEGRGLPAVPVQANPSPRSGETDQSGNFRLGPFRDIDRIVIRTGGRLKDPTFPWYDFQGEPVRTLSGQSLLAGQDIFLIGRSDLDPVCGVPDHDFLTYLRHMTRTTAIEFNPASTKLHRWEEYPLKVFVPVHTNNAGVSMDAAARSALATWNGVLEEDYFLPVDDVPGADIVFSFEDRENFYGQVSLLSPAGPGRQFGRVIPEKMGISIDTKLSTQPLVTGVALHELGHALGLYNHSDCQASGYLMEIAGGLGAMGRSEPVHPDEVRAVRCIRHLPQGQDMSGYDLP